MIARSPCEPVAMMLLVRVSSEKRTGTNVVSPSAPANCGPATISSLGKSTRSISIRFAASPLTILKTLICATAVGESSCSIKADSRSMLSAGAAIIRLFVCGSGVIWTSLSTPDRSNRRPSTSAVINSRTVDRSRCTPPAAAAIAEVRVVASSVARVFFSLKIRAWLTSPLSPWSMRLISSSSSFKSPGAARTIKLLVRTSGVTTTRAAIPCGLRNTSSTVAAARADDSCRNRYTRNWDSADTGWSSLAISSFMAVTASPQPISRMAFGLISGVIWILPCRPPIRSTATKSTIVTSAMQLTCRSW
jgi:hypothetical protein